MAMFQEYRGGIQPLSGISEAGGRIGEMYRQSLSGVGNDLATGLAAYYKNQEQADAKKTSRLTREALENIKPYDTESETLQFKGAQFGIQSQDQTQDTSTIQNFVRVNKQLYSNYKSNVLARAAEVGMPTPSLDSEDVVTARALSGLSNQLDSPGFVGSEADRQTLKAGISQYQLGMVEKAKSDEYDAMAQMWSQPEDVSANEFFSASDAYYGAEDATRKISGAVVSSSPTGGYTMDPNQTLEQAKKANVERLINTTNKQDLSPENRKLVEEATPLALNATHTLFVSEAPSVVASTKIDPKTRGVESVKSLNPVMVSQKWITPERFAQLKDPKKAAEFYDDHRQALVEYWAGEGLSDAEVAKRLNEFDAKNSGWKPESDAPKPGESTQGWEQRRAQSVRQHLDSIASENERAATSPLVTGAKVVGGTVATGAAVKAAIFTGKWAIEKAGDMKRATQIAKIRTSLQERQKAIAAKNGSLPAAARLNTEENILKSDVKKEIRRIAAEKKFDLSKLTPAQRDELETAARKAVYDKLGGVKAPKGKLQMAWDATKILLTISAATYGGKEAYDYTMPLVDTESAIEDDVNYFFNKGGLATEVARAEGQVNKAKIGQQAILSAQAADIAQKTGSPLMGFETFDKAFVSPNASIVNAGVGMAPVAKDPGLYTKQVFDYVRNAFPDADPDVITHVMKGMRPNHEFISDPQSGARFVLIRDAETGATKSVEQIKSFGTADGSGNVIGKPIMGDDGRLRGYMPINFGEGAVSVLGTFAPNIPQSESSRVIDSIESLAGALDTVQRMEAVFNEYGSEFAGEKGTYYEAAAMQMAALFRKKLGDSGTLTNQDVERLMAQIPNPSGLSGTFTFNSSHRTKFAFIKSYIENQIRQTGDRYNIGVRVRPKYSGTAKSAMQGVSSNQLQLTDAKIQLQTQPK